MFGTKFEMPPQDYHKDIMKGMLKRSLQRLLIIVAWQILNITRGSLGSRETSRTCGSSISRRSRQSNSSTWARESGWAWQKKI